MRTNFAGEHGNGRDAPKQDLPVLAQNRRFDPMRTRWSVGEQKNIICRQSCGSFGDGNAAPARCIPLLALDRPSNDLLKSSTVISEKGKPPLKR